ncbi:S8 family serine peptidase [Micromonospora sp. WMMC415]|uniref:S8 family serine peptidase n=1 Tax=Micromonospora sp. WMMC415 TaxID=2675222 RepID=UPI0012B44F43|nr:S8 family serine peptidase [Micromonospora sp. WMMC415]QGN48638.1 S8 family serine peptidase [Micromonospora sp. WMMC415]
MRPLPNRRSGLIALGVVTALTLAGTPATGAAPTGPAGPVPPSGTAVPPPSHGGTRTVTLITGDKVTVAATGGRAVHSVTGANGTSASFHRVVMDGSTYVYPDAALPYVTAGVLDQRLFNVTRLLADGYDDTRVDRLPLIVQYTDAAARSRSTATLTGSTLVRRLESVRGAAVTQDRDQAPAFWSALTATPAGTVARRSGTPTFAGGIARIWLDGKVTATLADSTAQIGAPEVWARGNTATGVKVAVLDSGVDPGHPDLAGQIDATTSFVPWEEYVDDYNGHGTHVASTIAGTGAASDGKERGVAPGARLHIGKVLDSEGRGQESFILAGMEWAARQEKARIINMSLGGAGTDGTDPMSMAVNTLSAETGALFVVAAGNSGPRTVGTPGTADAALTVGAVDGNDALADFSSQGPRTDGGLKPEITAPGVDILAARSQLGRGGSGHYRLMSGTSMATPHVAGAAALLAAAHPDWTGQRLKEALVSSVKATKEYTPYQAGAGRLDVAAAVDATVFATVSAYSGFQYWPHEPGKIDTKQVTYTNVGDAPVELALAVDVAGAPAGLFTLSADRVTVPANGTATVTLTAQMDRLAADQEFSGMITATDAAGVVRARTLIGAGKEGQRQNLTIVAKDRSGRPASGRVLITARELFTAIHLDEAGTATLRLPPGSYSGWLDADVQGANGPRSLGMALLSFTDVELDRDRTVTLDARQARQIKAHVPRQGSPVGMRLDVHRSYGDSLVESSTLPNESYDSLWALPTGTKVTDGEFEFGARFRLEQPALTVGTGSETYHDLLVKRGAAPLPKGTRKLTAVYAGDGSTGVLARHDVRGKAVVVRRSDTIEIRQQAEAAAAAGALLLLVAGDGIGRLQPWDETPWTPESPAPLTVATLNADQGASLIEARDRGRVELTVDSNPTTEYLYDVVRHWKGAVPTDPTWRVDQRDLARVDVSFRNHRPGKAREFRADVWHGWIVGNELTAPAQGERTDWVTAGVDWYESAGINGETGQASITVLRYPARQTSRVSWFGPIHRPRMGPLDGLPVRYLDAVYIPVPGWGDSGSGHVGDAYGNWDVRNRATLYQGERELRWGNAEFLPVSGLSAERLPYRLVVDNDRADWANPYSRRTLTEWSFTSAATGAESAETLPLIQLDYGVETDVAGRAARNGRLTVTASHLPGVTAGIRAVTVEVSYDDGATWQRTALTRDGDGWRTSLKAPKFASFVTLRTTAGDSAGNTVSQTITRAFGLR